MAWNRPRDVKKVEKKGQGRQWNVLLKGLVAAGVVVVGAGIAAWLLWPEGNGAQVPSKPSCRDRRIGSPKAEAHVDEDKIESGSNRLYLVEATGDDTSDTVQKASLTTVRGERRVREPVSLEEKVFTHSADQFIAQLMMMEPGEEIVGEVDDMFADFKNQFLKAITEPIVIQQSDSDIVREMKQCVKQARMELKDRLDRGEDIEKVMIETRSELQRLGQYRNELSEMLDRYCEDETASVEDVEDFTKAANIMLEGKGAKKLEMPDFVVQHLKMIRKLKGDNHNEEDDDDYGV